MVSEKRYVETQFGALFKNRYVVLGCHIIDTSHWLAEHQQVKVPALHHDDEFRCAEEAAAHGSGPCEKRGEKGGVIVEDGEEGSMATVSEVAIGGMHVLVELMTYLFRLYAVNLSRFLGKQKRAARKHQIGIWTFSDM